MAFKNDPNLVLHKLNAIGTALKVLAEKFDEKMSTVDPKNDIFVPYQAVLVFGDTDYAYGDALVTILQALELDFELEGGRLNGVPAYKIDFILPVNLFVPNDADTN